jgi:zinc/manganese transport system substrate-binding protein
MIGYGIIDMILSIITAEAWFGRIDMVRNWLAVAVLLAAFVLAACGSDDEGAGGDADTNAEGGALNVVATTTQIADMARNVAGERANVSGLIPANADVHAFEPTPRDVERVADADLVLMHGMELDAWAEELVRQSGTNATVVVVTEGVRTIEADDVHDDEHEHDDDHDHDHEGTPEADKHAHDDDHGHDHGEVDPHVWLDVANAKVMVENIRDALIAADPDGRQTYEANANAYLAELDELDSWIREQIALIPESDRKLVTSHDAFGYYVNAYGLEVVGAVIPSLDSQAQPSARETAELIDRIQEEGVKAIFTEAAINPDLARQLAEEAGVKVVDDLYADSLGPEGSGAETYIGMMRTNTTKIVEALR